MAASIAGLVNAGTLDRLKERGCTVITGGGHVIAVFYHDGRVFAVDNRCPHMGFPLNRGSVKHGILTCHWHHARFDLSSGGTFDPFADDVRTFPVRIVDGEGGESSLPLPAEINGHLGIFMVGAYQEILGDMHNLFGDTDSVDVDVTDAGEIVLDHAIQGDTVSSVLRYVNYDPDRLLESLEQHCRQAHLSDDEQEGFIELVRDGLAGYTYLE